MNWFDYVVAGVAIIGLLIGWKMGLLGAIFNTIGVVVGIFIAGRFSGQIASWIAEQGTSDAVATVLAYVVIVVGVFVAAQVAKGVVKKMLSLVFLGWVDSLGSILVGLVFGLALAGAVILAVARFGSDLPTEGPVGTVVEMTGFRGSIQGALVESTLVPVFIDITKAIPANAMGFVPGDFRLALEDIEQRINEAKQP
ncbi:MAG: CvpA family protein [Dehalococcoidia bacterium]|nr:CvpA family protein [Dehalococcoidia bacterium]